MPALSQADRDILFTNARTHSHWQDKPVPDSLLEEMYTLASKGPTSANCCPARFVFITTDEAREKLRPCLIPPNVAQTMSAPVTVIIGYDSCFYDRVPELYTHNPGAREWFNGSDEAIYENAMRNGTLQGAYLMLAARSLGLDCGPMSGFDDAAVNAAFWPDGRFKANFLCNMGYGVAEKLHPRLPRLAFDDACRVD